MAAESTEQSPGPAAIVYLLAFGAAEVLILYLLLALDTPLSGFAWRAASTWPGRVVLALIGLGLIIVFMIVLLTILERCRQHGGSAPGPHAGLL